MDGRGEMCEEKDRGGLPGWEGGGALLLHPPLPAGGTLRGEVAPGGAAFVARP